MRYLLHTFRLLLPLLCFGLVAVIWAGVDVTFKGGSDNSFEIANNTPGMVKLGGFRYETKGVRIYSTPGWPMKGQSSYDNGGKRWYDVFLQADWQSRSAGDRFSAPLGWGDLSNDPPLRPEPLMKIGSCSDPLPYEDADPLTLEQLAVGMKNPLYYDASYRYVDSLGANGGLFSGGWIDTWIGETQFQFAIPTEQFRLSNTDTRFATENTGKGPFLWMSLSGYQEFFGGDMQWLIGVGMKETWLLTNQVYQGWNDGSGYTPFEVESPTWIGRMGGYPQYFPHQECVQKSTDGTEIPQKCGSTMDGMSALYLGPTGGPSHTENGWIVNEVFGSGLVWWYNYDIMSAASHLGFREVLMNAHKGGDPLIGICLMAVTYNRGINSGNPDLLKPKAQGGRLEDILDNPNACDEVVQSGFGDYTIAVRNNVRILVDANKKAFKDPSVALLERWITWDDIEEYYFGIGGDLESYVAVLKGADVSTLKGGLMMHYRIPEVEVRAMWSEVQQAFNMQAQKWGGSKISLRYDWLSNLRIAKKFFDRARPQVGGYEATAWIAARSTGDKDVNGRTLDMQYPFASLLALQDDQGLQIDVRTTDPRPNDRGIARVEWTFNEDWSNFSNQGVALKGGSALAADYTIRLSNDQLGNRLEEGGIVYVRVADSCGNAIVTSAPVEGMKLPKILDAYILDTDGDGHGDRIVVETKEDDDVTLRFSDATGLRYSWPSPDNALDGDVGLIKAGTFQIDDKTLVGGAAEGLGGRVEILFSNTTLKKSVADSVGPVVRYASIQEKNPRELFINFSENILPLSDVAIKYLEINGTAVAISALEQMGQIWKFVLVDPLDVSRVEQLLDSVRIVPQAISDPLNNGAAENNIKVPIMLDKGPLELADDGLRYLDRNFDGTMDRIELKFKQPALGRTGTMTLTYSWPTAERTLSSSRYTVKEFKIDGSKLEVDPQNSMVVFYDATQDSLRQFATWFDLSRDGWGAATLLQKSLNPAIPDQNDPLKMVDAMGPIAKLANYGETSIPNKRPDTLSVEFSEPIDTTAAQLFSSRLYFTKSGMSGEQRYAHEQPTLKKRYRNQILSLYFEPHLIDRPGIGDSLRLVYEGDEEGVIQDLAGNRAPPYNPWVLINGKLRVQISGGDLFVTDGMEGIPSDTALFFESTFNLDSLTARRAGIGFTISFIDSGGVSREQQRFSYDLAVFSNLGGFVRKIGGSFNCVDLEKSGNHFLAAACDPSRYAASQKVKIFIPWDYRSQKGQLVGSGAYLQKVSVRGSRIETLLENRMFGVVRKASGGEKWDLSDP